MPLMMFATGFICFKLELNLLGWVMIVASVIQLLRAMAD